MAEIIALCGPQRAGKSLAAKSLARNYGYIHMSFADPLYEMLAALFGVTADELRLYDKSQTYSVLEGKTLRHALQTLGTEWGRDKIGSRVWVNNARDRAFRAVAAGKRVVFDDCRFYNEYTVMKEHLQAKIVHIDRPGADETINPGHGSELEWPHFICDAVAMNDAGSGDRWLDVAADAILGALGTEAPASSFLGREDDVSGLPAVS